MSRKPLPCPDCGGPKSGLQGERLCPPCKTRRQTCPSCGERKLMASTHCAHCDYALRQGRGSINGRTEKRCPRCQRTLPMEAFPPNGSKANAYCRPCYRRYLLENRAKRVYGITGEQYDAILAAQAGRCAICQNLPRTMNLAIDHNHKTGEVRGLLCRRCNQNVLGGAREDPEMLRRAARYLESPPARKVLAE